MNKKLRITLLVDHQESWIVPYAEAIQSKLSAVHDVSLCFHVSDIQQGDLLFLLGCTSIIAPDVLRKNQHNLVIHESDLPQGRGWSPIAWQVLEGKNSIPIVLFEAVEELDAGPVYLRDTIELDGTELLGEIKQKQGLKTAELVYRFIDQWPDIEGIPQTGQPSFYPKRTRKDDQLDISQSLESQFNHLRIVDNEKYPSWFEYKGKKYILKIYPDSP